MIAIHRTIAGWVSSDRRRIALPVPAPTCSGTTANHNGRGLATYVVGGGAGRTLTTMCSGCFSVYESMGAAIFPERRS